MVDSIDITSVANRLNEEFVGLIEERTELRAQIQKLSARAEEIERKIAGIQRTLQGLSLYSSAQEVPTELTKKTVITFGEIVANMQRIAGERLEVDGPDVPKTLRAG